MLYPYLAELRLLKSVRGITGVRYIIYDLVEDAYFIASVSYRGEGSILSKHEGRVDNPESLLDGDVDQMTLATVIRTKIG